MSLSWPAVNGTYIETTVATTGGIGSGAYTVLALAQPNGTTVGAYWGAQITTSYDLQAILDVGVMFGANDFSAGALGAQLSGTDWQIIGQSKASGSAVYRWHHWNYTTSSAKTHVDGTGTHANPGAITKFRIGQGDNRGNGLIAVVAVWKRVLSDAEIDSLCTTNLSDWAALAPDALWPLNVASAASVVDVSGNGNHAASVSGTITGSAADPPAFSYTLSAATPSTAPASAIPPHLIQQFAAVRAASFTPSRTPATITGTAVSTPGALTPTALGTPETPVAPPPYRSTPPLPILIEAATARMATFIPSRTAATVPGTALATLGGATGTVLGLPTVLGTAASAPGALAATVAGLPTVPGTAGAPLGALNGTAVVGAAAVTGTAAATLGRVVGTVAGAVAHTGTAAAPLGRAAATVTGTHTHRGTAAALLGRVVAGTSGAAPTTGLVGNAHGPLPVAAGAVVVHNVSIAGAVT